MRRYQLWDRDSANLIGDFAGRSDALDFVRTEIEAHGPGAVDDMALVRVQDDRRTLSVVAAGRALLDLIQARIATR